MTKKHIIELEDTLVDRKEFYMPRKYELMGMMEYYQLELQGGKR